MAIWCGCCEELDHIYLSALLKYSTTEIDPITLVFIKNNENTYIMSDYDYDLFVIGAGSGGVRAARMSASYGARVGIAEDRYLGGTCVNVGCVPKKLFVYASHVSEEIHNAKGFGWDIDHTSFDWSNVDKE